MAKLSLLLLAVCTTCLLDLSVGLNYYIQLGPNSKDLLTYPVVQPFPTLWKPDCDKKKDSEDSSESSSSESSDSDSSESSSSEESKESGEGGESKEIGESKEGGGSNEGEEKKEGKSEEGSSSSSSESKESSEESGEKKEEKKKKERKYVFPPRSYDFPPSSKVQKIVYSPFAYLPYRSTYVVQQPALSYPQKSGYQYVSVPATSAVVSGYPSPIIGRNRLMDSPITKIVYSPSALTYPVSSKTIFSPGAQVYSASLGYLKK